MNNDKLNNNYSLQLESIDYVINRKGIIKIVLIKIIKKKKMCFNRIIHI
jgi:hypothetical protein